MDIRTLREILAKGDVLGERACDESLEWLATLPQDAPAQHAWDTCERANWMCWIVGASSAHVEDAVIRAIRDVSLPLEDAFRSYIKWETIERAIVQWVEYGDRRSDTQRALGGEL